MYSEENPNDWDRIYQRKMNSLRLRPTELNLQPVHSVTKVVEEGPTPEEGKKQSYLPSSFRLPVLFSLLNTVFIIIAINAILFFSEAAARKHIALSVGLATLVTENLLSHPFIVLRRQCQVHHNSKRNHILAVTLVPVVIRLHQRQGLTTLWKGLGSTLLVRGMTLAVEDLISKVTPWPK